MDVWEAIHTKRAVRIFADKPLPEDAVRRILDAGRRSQSSKNTQPWHFIAIQDRDTLQKLSKMGDFMGHVAGAALCVAIIAENESWWTAFDLGQCAAYMQLEAQEFGIGSVIGSVYHPDEAKTLLGVPSELSFNVVISFGYPGPEQPRRGSQGGRRPLEEVVHWDRW